MSAVFERAAIPEKDRKPAYLIIDEFADYADDSMEPLLTQCRKYKLGCLFAHQSLSQTSTSLTNIIAGNTSIKVAGGISDRDARALAPDMRTTVEHLTNLKKTDRSAQFMAYIRNKTGRALTIEVPFGLLEAQPKMTAAEHAALIARNRARYSATPIGTSPMPPPKNPFDYSKEPIVTFTPRPVAMEPWRLDSADKKKDDDPKPSKDY